MTDPVKAEALALVRRFRLTLSMFMHNRSQQRADAVLRAARLERRGAGQAEIRAVLRAGKAANRRKGPNHG